jgi:hypothetical protein
MIILPLEKDGNEVDVIGVSTSKRIPSQLLRWAEARKTDKRP